jgi:acyl carrier protein
MLKDIIDLISECLEKDVAVIKGADEFRNYEEWDSLAYLSVIAAIDDNYGLVVPIEDFRACRTVEALAAYVDSHKE